MSKAAAKKALHDSAASDFLTITIAEQIFGIPVLQVQDVLGTQKVTKIPLAPPEVAGALNLRGRIVTAVDVRQKLGLEPRGKDEKSMSVVVEHLGELYSLVIDKVGDVLNLSGEDYENTGSGATCRREFTGSMTVCWSCSMSHACWAVRAADLDKKTKGL